MALTADELVSCMVMFRSLIATQRLTLNTNNSDKINFITAEINDLAHAIRTEFTQPFPALTGTEKKLLRDLTGYIIRDISRQECNIDYTELRYTINYINTNTRDYPL